MTDRNLSISYKKRIGSILLRSELAAGELAAGELAAGELAAGELAVNWQTTSA